MTMDLSGLPAHTRHTDAMVKMVLLNEILDRVELPAYSVTTFASTTLIPEPATAAAILLLTCAGFGRRHASR